LARARRAREREVPRLAVQAIEDAEGGYRLTTRRAAARPDDDRGRQNRRALAMQ
jgi:hypothetical protein